MMIIRGTNPAGHVYEGASGQQRKVILWTWYVKYTVTKAGAAGYDDAHLVVGKTYTQAGGYFEHWAMKKIS